MDVNRLVNMIAKLFFVTLSKHLIQSWRRSSTATGGDDQPEDRQQAAEAKELEKRARDTAKLMRRLGR